MPVRPREHLQRLEPYEWEAFTADIAVQAGIAEHEVVRYDTNTVAWPPVAWEQTVLDLPRVAANEYPHPSNEPLRSALAEHLGVAPDQVVVTCGADEALLLAASVVLGPGLKAVLPTPTFSMFRVVTESLGATVLPVPLDDVWLVPREPLLAALRDPDVRLAWLCSPNNPTGRLIDETLIEDAAAAAPDVLFVLDEAYAEVAGTSLAYLLPRYENLVVVRTFSKGYGLAGARVGYAVGARSVTRLLDAVRLPQNLSIFGIQAATRALQDQAGLQARVAEIRRQRETMAQALTALGWTLVPSHANFLLGQPAVDAVALARWLQGAGMVVRSYGGNPRLASFLRVTVRSPEENARLLARMRAFRRED